MVSGAEFFASGEEREEREREIVVWDCNVPSVEVFERCRLDVVAGMAVFYNGIAPPEIRATLQLMGVPAAEWPDLLDDIQFMGRCASDALNERSKNRESAPKG